MPKVKNTIASAPRLRDQDIAKAVDLLDTWKGKLTWDLYLVELEKVLGHRYTKVAMLNRSRIADAWSQAKGRTRESVAEARHGEVLLSKTIDQIEGLRQKTARLEMENGKLLEQFLRWSYNAYRLGVTIDQLDASLPPIDRGSTRTS
ncbi:MAG: hypothetical protein JNN20_16190 [Betaproteobacteria bacterium]|nr:hypothetical protein [Betaproteobacteria bacterium]